MELWEVAGVTIILMPLALTIFGLTYKAFRGYAQDIRRRRKGLKPHPGYDFWNSLEDSKRLQSCIEERIRASDDDVRQYIEELLSEFIEQSNHSG